MLPDYASFAECNHRMLKSGLLSDVTFEAGIPSVPLQAHRYVLVSRSPVFEAMFCGPMKVDSGAKVIVEDIEVDIFRSLLR